MLLFPCSSVGTTLQPSFALCSFLPVWLKQIYSGFWMKACLRDWPPQPGPRGNSQFDRNDSNVRTIKLNLGKQWIQVWFFKGVEGPCFSAERCVFLKNSTVFFVLYSCLPHKAFETVRRSICESNVQKEEVAAAAAPVESVHPLCLWRRDYTLNPGMLRQKDRKKKRLFFSERHCREKKIKGGFPD